jgi:hypothetical protein
MPAINLQETFGDKYKVVDDGTDDPCRAERIWCQEIRGKLGVVYPYGVDGKLAVRIGSTTKTKTDVWAKRLEKAGFPVVQRGDWEIVFKFNLDHFHYFADLIKAKKRRQLTSEQKVKALAALAKAGKQTARAMPCRD